MDDSTYRTARRRVVRRLIMQITFAADLLFFILITLDILLSPKHDVVGALTWALIWGVVLAIHAMFTFDLFSRRIHQATLRELDRERMQEKPKRQQLELGDDGELVDLQDDALVARHSNTNRLR